MSRIERSIDLNATAAQVWAVITDFAAYSEWNPFIREAAGEARVGSQLRLRMQPRGRSATPVRPTILVAEPEQELRWLGHIVIPGLFDGEHVFRITRLDAGRVRFTQEESFRGILAPFFGGGFLEDTAASFDAMNRALQERIAARDSSRTGREQ
jgi:hypothetical protein